MKLTREMYEAIKGLRYNLQKAKKDEVLKYFNYKEYFKTLKDCKDFLEKEQIKISKKIYERDNSNKEEKQTLKERLLILKENDFSKNFERIYSKVNNGVNCNHNKTINFIHRVSEYTNWGYYSKNYRYPKIWKTDDITANFSEYKVFSEYKIIDGMLNLSIYSEKNISGIKILSAEWIVRKKGYNFATQKGYIAILNENAYHAETIKKAITGLKRKIKKLKEINKPITLETKITKKWYHDIIGACYGGINEWINKYPELQNKRSITLKELLKLTEGDEFWGKDKLLLALGDITSC